jgi:hypothetical protein
MSRSEDEKHPHRRSIRDLMGSVYLNGGFSMKPVIGITTYGRYEQSMKSIHYDSFYVLPVDYASAVR